MYVFHDFTWKKITKMLHVIKFDGWRVRSLQKFLTTAISMIDTGSSSTSGCTCPVHAVSNKTSSLLHMLMLNMSLLMASSIFYTQKRQENMFSRMKITEKTKSYSGYQADVSEINNRIAKKMTHLEKILNLCNTVNTFSLL